MNDDDLSDEVHGDTDPSNLSDDDSGDQGAPATGQTSAGDGLPGYPAGGDPGWRAGVFGSGDGLLGMAKVSDLVARPGDEAAVLQPVSDPVMDQERNSWRWNDPEALAYDLDRKQRELAEAKGVASFLGGVGDGQTAASLLGKWFKPIGALANPEAGAAGLALGTYMGSVEAPRIQSEINAMQNQLRQLGNGAKT